MNTEEGLGLIDELIRFRENNGFVFGDDEKAKAEKIVARLVEIGYWPAKNKTGQYTALRMWECYGPFWNIYSRPRDCPKCKADLCDRENGPPFKREIGITENDRCLRFRCPDCGGEW